MFSTSNARAQEGMKHEHSIKTEVTNLKVNLPKLHLPNFDGNIQNFGMFLNLQFMNKLYQLLQSLLT